MHLKIQRPEANLLKQTTKHGLKKLQILVPLALRLVLVRKAIFLGLQKNSNWTSDNFTENGSRSWVSLSFPPNRRRHNNSRLREAIKSNYCQSNLMSWQSVKLNLFRQFEFVPRQGLSAVIVSVSASSNLFSQTKLSDKVKGGKKHNCQFVTNNLISSSPPGRKIVTQNNEIKRREKNIAKPNC